MEITEEEFSFIFQTIFTEEEIEWYWTLYQLKLIEDEEQ
jgi:hypothetical protein